MQAIKCMYRSLQKCGNRVIDYYGRRRRWRRCCRKGASLLLSQRPRLAHSPLIDLSPYLLYHQCVSGEDRLSFSDASSDQYQGEYIPTGNAVLLGASARLAAHVRCQSSTTTLPMSWLTAKLSPSVSGIPLDKRTTTASALFHTPRPTCF